MSEPAFHRKKSAISARLLRRRPIAAVARLGRARGIKGWIVGGAPRDSLLGIPPLDLDVAVSRDAEGVARELEGTGLGRAVVLSDESPRVVRVAGKTCLDLADVVGGSIERDLARRDFTANALAIEISTGAWLDPFGGAADLAARRLSLVREENLAEDPLRAFRAARFYATHGLRPDRAVERACRKIAPELRRVAAERVETELSKLLSVPIAAPAFRWASRTGLLPHAFDLKIGPVGLRRAERTLARLDIRLRRFPDEQRRAVRLAAIAGAAGLSPAEAAAWLRRRRFGRSEAAVAARLLELARSAPSAPPEKDAWAWIYDAGPLAPAALLLRGALRAGGRRLESRLERLYRRRRRAGLRIGGGDVMRWLDLPAGPRIGELLREIGIEAMRGGLETRGDARQWLRRRFGENRQSPSRRS